MTIYCGIFFFATIQSLWVGLRIPHQTHLCWFAIMKLPLKAIQVVDIPSEYAAVVTISSGLYVMLTFQEEKKKNPDHFPPCLSKGRSNHDCGRLPITIKSVSGTYDKGHPTSLSADPHHVVLLKQVNWLFATCFCYKHCFHQGFVNC